MNSLLLIGVIAGLLTLELAVVTKKATKSLVKQIAKLVPNGVRPRWEEEWLRHMEDLQGAPLMSMLWLVGLTVAAVRISSRSHAYNLTAAAREARHMIRISRNLHIVRDLDWKAHAMLCPDAWRCTDSHRVKARRDGAYWRAVASMSWWAVGTISVVFRPSVGIDRAVGRLLRVPLTEDFQITPVERREFGRQAGPARRG